MEDEDLHEMDDEIDVDNFDPNIKLDDEMAEIPGKTNDHIEPIELNDIYAPNNCKLDFV